MKETFLRLSKLFGNDYQITPMHDFEISPITKRPTVLVQTAGHVAGAVRFYQKHDLKEETENDADNSESEKNFINRIDSSKVFPVCLHPKYGGWFALRGILLFKGVNVVDSYLNRSDPPKILKTTYDIANLLYLFNEHWRDSRYRDIGMPSDVERYSDLQIKYFGTEPSERSELIKEMIQQQRRQNLIQHSNNSLTEKLSIISI
jgi:methylmalonic aciduria homocystinuria type C protein